VVSNELWWYVARSAGLVAWVAALASVLIGLALSTRALGPRPRGPWLLDLHRLLGALTLGLVALHLGALVADNFVHFGTADLLVPFASGYRTSAVAWGVVAFWFLAAVEATSLLRHRIPRRVWYGVHLSSYAVALAATLHGLYAGSDAANPAFRWIGLAALGAVGFFTIYRLLAPAGPGGTNPARAKRPAAVYTAQRQPHGPQPPDWL